MAQSKQEAEFKDGMVRQTEQQLADMGTKITRLMQDKDDKIKHQIKVAAELQQASSSMEIQVYINMYINKCLFIIHAFKKYR